MADGLLVVAFVLIAAWEHFLTTFDHRAGPLAVNLLMTGIVVGSLSLRRVAPVHGLFLMCLALIVPTFFVQHDFFVWSHLLPALIITYAVARHRGTAWGVGAGLIAAATAGFNLLAIGESVDSFWGLLLIGVSVAVGIVIRRNAAQHARIAAALRQLLEEQQISARLAVLAERARVARDLHDIVSSAVSVMVVQARVATDLLASDPAGAATSIGALEGAGRAATAELRRMLGLLRVGHEQPDPGPPAPGLDALDTLLTRMRQAGLDIRFSVDGSRPALPAGFEVTAYRIVQEALTNVLRHVGPVAVQLKLRFGPAVAIEVVDAGPAAAPATPVGSQAPGHGLVGMRERVGLLGGVCEAGPHAFGFRVRVELPLPEAA